MKGLSFCLLALALAGAPSALGQGHPGSAWDALIARDPGLIHEIGPVEQEVLQLMTVRQAQDYLAGTGPAQIVLANGETMEAFLHRNGLPTFEIPFFSIAGSGPAPSTGGGYELRGTFSGMEGEAMAGGEYTMVGSFWAVVQEADAGTCTAPEGIFCDGFESGDAGSWNRIVGQAPAAN